MPPSGSCLGPLALKPWWPNLNSKLLLSESCLQLSLLLPFLLLLLLSTRLRIVARTSGPRPIHKAKCVLFVLGVGTLKHGLCTKQASTCHALTEAALSAVVPQPVLVLICRTTAASLPTSLSISSSVGEYIGLIALWPRPIKVLLEMPGVSSSKALLSLVHLLSMPILLPGLRNSTTRTI